MKALRISVTGIVEEVDVTTIYSMAQAIGCRYVEVVRPRGFGERNLRTGYPVLVVDEQGSFDQTALFNPRASTIYGGTIYGDVLVLGEGMVMQHEGYEDPDFKGLDEIPQRHEDGWAAYVLDLTGADR